jgi:hypothetical protein
MAGQFSRRGHTGTHLLRHGWSEFGKVFIVADAAGL